MSPAHRAALRFLRGGLVAIVALLIPSQLGGLSRGSPWLAPLVDAARLLIPAFGFAAGGLLGATALGRGRRGLAAFGAGFLLTGIGISFVAPLVQNLTGFESRPTVALVAAGGTGAAFGVGGLVAGMVLERRRLLSLVVGFAVGGALGGLITVAPALGAAAVAGWSPDVQLFFRLFCSLAGLLAPFAIAGAVAGRTLGETEEGPED